MANPKTQHELNEAVISALDIECTCHIGDGDCPHYDVIDKDFATNKAAAVWALERFCDEQKLQPVFEKYEGIWYCELWQDFDGRFRILKKGRGTFCEAICRAIVGAE